MNEKLMMTILPMCTFLFAFGGYRQKVWRRFVLPIVLGLLLYFFTELSHDRIIGFTLVSIFAFHLGYGDGSPYWKKALTFVSYSVPSMVFSFTIWQAINPVVFMVLFWMSKEKKQVVWKNWEAIVGLLFGVCLIQVIGD